MRAWGEEQAAGAAHLGRHLAAARLGAAVVLQPGARRINCPMPGCESRLLSCQQLRFNNRAAGAAQQPSL